MTSQLRSERWGRLALALFVCAWLGAAAAPCAMAMQAAASGTAATDTAGHGHHALSHDATPVADAHCPHCPAADASGANCADAEVGACEPVPGAASERRDDDGSGWQPDDGRVQLAPGPAPPARFSRATAGRDACRSDLRPAPGRPLSLTIRYCVYLK